MGFNLNIQKTFSRTFLGKMICGLCALCGVFILTLPIPIGRKPKHSLWINPNNISVVVSSFAQCYKRKLWRNEIATRRRMAGRLHKSEKSDILFNLATSGDTWILIGWLIPILSSDWSGGLSGVRKESEVFPSHISDVPEYDKLIKLQNQVLMDNKVDKRKQKLA